MMQALRQNTKWIMLAVAIAFVGLMVFQWGMDISGRSSAQNAGGELGRVNGESIAYEEFNSVYRNLYEQQQQTVNGPIGTAMNRQIEDAAWEQLVMQHLIAQELRRRGIVVTDEEVLAAARSEPPPEFQRAEIFQTNGQFDIGKYQQFLANPAVDTELLLRLEAYYRDAIPRSKLFFQQTSGIYASDDELWQIWRDTRDVASIRFLAFDPAALVQDASVTVSDAEIASYYRDHKTEFLRPARARVKYLVMERLPNAADTAAAKARVNALRAEVMGGADFAEVARRESADSVSARDGGQMVARKGGTVPAFEQAVWAQPLGQVGPPVETQFGYHIIKVEKRTADSATVRHILVPVTLTPEHEDQVLDRADSLDVLTETLKLDAIGSTLGMQVAETELIPGLAFLPGVGDAADGADWAFHKGQPGELSEVYETPTAYYVLELINREEERTLTQEEATQTIRSGLIQRKKVEQAVQRARDAVDRIRAGQSIDDVAKSMNVEVREAGPFTRADFVPGLGRMNAAIGTAFGLRPGDISGAVEADGQVYVIQLVSRRDADRAAWEQQKEDQRSRVNQALAQQRWDSYLDALRRSANVVDNREQLLRPPAAVTS